MGSVQLISQNSALGYGLKYGEIMLAERVNAASEDHAHSKILQWGIYGGVPAMVLYVAGLTMLAVRQLRRVRQLDATAIIAIACCAEYLCSSMFGVVMITTAPYFWLFVGSASRSPPMGSVRQKATRCSRKGRAQRIQKMEPSLRPTK